MTLLERDEYLAGLITQFRNASSGNGQVAVVCGDAGIGKTSLVESFTQQQENNAKIYWGACDALFTPRPLAPLYDIAGRIKSSIMNKLEQEAPRPSIFNEFLNEIHKAEPNIIVIEDVHWADESTFDFIIFLAKRISKYRSLLIITYRSDEIGSRHPLRLSLSNIPTQYLKRYELKPLSINAVKVIAKNFGRDGESIFSSTNGNPFLITELLINSRENVPTTVKDLMIFRLTRLSEDSRSAVETFSIIPGAVEKWLINHLIKNYSVVDEAVESGLLKIENDSVSFRHELLKIAVEESLSESIRFEKNTAVLNILLSQKNTAPFLARIMHHAAKTANTEVIFKFAPLAAKQAARLGAHEQALKHYRTALQYSEHIYIEEQLNLLEGYTHECYLTARIEEGIESCESALKILKDHHDPVREGENFRRLSRLLWYYGKDKKGEEFILKAIETLEKFPAGEQLAMSYSNLSQIFMLREKTDEAVMWGEKALDLARTLNNIEIKAHALNNIGSAKMFASDDSGEKYLSESLELSLQNDLHEHVCRAYVNLGTASMYRRNLSEADKFFSDAVEYANEKDIKLASLCVAGEAAEIKLHLGKWDEAFEVSYEVYANDKAPVMDRLLPATIIGLIRARRNDPGAFQLLDEVNGMVYDTGELMKLVKVKAARAEAFWLKNELQTNIEELITAYDFVKTSDNPWAIGEIAYWLWKGEKLQKIPKPIALPYLLQIEGKWAEASEQWEKLKCPYEQAIALSEGNEQAMRKSVEIFERLSASAASQLVKQKMRKSGIKNIPKGPRQSTKENPSGLTKRQMEILELVAKGLSNSEIGKKLYISARTVENHISTIFSKLNIRTRTEAAAMVHTDRIKK